MANEMWLIDVNAVNWGRCPADARLAKAWLDEAPTVDAKPVVHGWWYDDYNDPRFICSECRAWFLVANADGDMNYCPNCGAKMDGGEGDG